MGFFTKLFSKNRLAKQTNQKRDEHSSDRADALSAEFKQNDPVRRCRKCNSPYDLEYTGGLCFDCWKKVYFLKKQFYSSYVSRLKNELHDIGIDVFKESTEGLLEYGEPIVDESKCEDTEANFPRENERMLFTVKCRDCVFAFPYNGIGLRCIDVSPESPNYEWAKNIHLCKSILGLCSDGKELYYITEAGLLESTSPKWSPKVLFDPIDEYRNICESITDEQAQEELKKRIQESSSSKWGIIYIGDPNVFYDARKKVFFKAIPDDNIFHYIGVDYEVIEKASVFSRYIRIDMFDVYMDMHENKLPNFAFIDRLPVDSTVKEYIPEDDKAFQKTFLPW